MMGQKSIERMDERLTAIAAALTTSLSTRTVKRGQYHYDEHNDAELSAGVVMVVSAGEGRYSKGIGMAAKEGTHRIFLVGHLKVAETDPRQAIEDAEINLIEEIKAFVRSGVAGMSLSVERVEQSRQLEHPYGWVLVFIDAGPVRATVN